MKIKTIKPEYVSQLPDVLTEGILYICEEFNLAAHKCCCGCGEEVITPLNEAQWCVIKQGTTVSLWPSIGNWKYACRSHYWITENRIIKGSSMTDTQIEEVIKRDLRDKDKYIQLGNKKGTKVLTKSWFESIIQRIRSIMQTIWRW